jgi:hypothetical protein
MLEFDRFGRFRSWLGLWLIRLGMVRAAIRVIPGARYSPPKGQTHMIVQLWSGTKLIGTAEVPEKWPGSMPDAILWRGHYYLLVEQYSGGGPSPGPHFVTYFEREDPKEPYGLGDDAVLSS